MGDEFVKKEARLRKLWHARLANQMAALPHFDEVYRAVAFIACGRPDAIALENPSKKKGTAGNLKQSLYDRLFHNAIIQLFCKIAMQKYN